MADCSTCGPRGVKGGPAIPVAIVCDNSTTTDTGPIESASHIRTRCMCDDIAGNGSNIVSFVEVYVDEWDGATLSSTFAGSFTDDSLVTAYTPVNPSKCDDIGDTIVGVIGDGIELTGGTWSLPKTATSVTVSVISSLGTVPVTTTSGVLNMVPTQSHSWGNTGNHGGGTVIGPIEVTTSATDVVHVTWTELAT